MQCLLVVEPGTRWSARRCLSHPWLLPALSHSSAATEELRRLETGALRSWLARRRWVRCCAAVRAALRLARERERRAGARAGESYLATDRELCLRSGLLLTGIYGRWKVAYM